MSIDFGKDPAQCVCEDAEAEKIRTQMVSKVRQMETLSKCEGAIIGARILIGHAVSALQDIRAENQEEGDGTWIEDLAVAIDENAIGILENVQARYKIALGDLQELEDEMDRHMEGAE